MLIWGMYESMCCTAWLLWVLFEVSCTIDYNKYNRARWRQKEGEAGNERLSGCVAGCNGVVKVWQSKRAECDEGNWE